MQKWPKISQKSSLDESGQCKNNFMGLDHLDNTLQRSVQSFQTNYCICLRKANIKTERQTDKQKI